MLFGRDLERARLGALLDEARASSVAVGVNIVTRNTAVSIGAQVAFAIVTGAGLAGQFQAESGYTRAFALAAAGSALALLLTVLLPGRAAERR